MKKIIIIAASAALLLVSCTKTPDPVRDAIQAEILGMEQGFTSVSFRSLEKVDSSTFAQELDKKVKTFELKKQSDEKFLMKYMQENKTKNAELKRASYTADLQMLASLDSLKGTLSPIMNDIAYYVYKFSADAKGDAASMSFSDAYVALTPSNEVLGMASKFLDLSKRLGKVIPGYMDIVKTDDPVNLDEE